MKKNVNNEKEMKAPAWFVKGFNEADSLLADALKVLGVTPSWAGYPQKIDSGKIANLMLELRHQNRLSDDDLERIRRKMLMRQYLSQFLWEKFREEKIGTPFNAEELQYDPEKKVVRIVA